MREIYRRSRQRLSQTENRRQNWPRGSDCGCFWPFGRARGARRRPAAARALRSPSRSTIPRAGDFDRRQLASGSILERRSHSSRRREVQVSNFGARLGSGGAEQGHPARGRRANPTVSSARAAHPPGFDDARPRRAPFLARASIRGALKPARPGRAARARSEFLGGRESAWRGRQFL